MHLLWLSIFLLLICFISESIPLNYVTHDGGATDNTSVCNSVPYPFGAPGAALKGFEVVCTSTTIGNRSINHHPYRNLTQVNLNPSLQLSTGAYLIQNISLHGQVNIFTGPIYQQCDYGGDETLTRGTGWLNLTGTPFTLSKDYTTFVVIGCDDYVIIKGVAGVGNGGGEDFRSGGCVAFCSNSSSIIDGSCSGLGCCQMPLPGPGDLKSFELNLFKVQNTGVNELRNCSTAFFAMRDEFLFRAAHIKSKTYFSDNQPNHVVVLNWAIGDKSCEEAEKDLNSFACKKNSKCYDSLNGVGYLCNCSQGYEGNPYAQGGCWDIDECQFPDMYPCNGVCKNVPGTYECSCPKGTHGNATAGQCISDVATRSGFLIGVATAVGIFLLILAMLVLFYKLKKTKEKRLKKKHFLQNRGLLLQQLLRCNEDVAGRMKIFSIEELEMATNKFDKTRLLGRGGHGEVYKGILSDKRVVAIKKSLIAVKSEINQFINEVAILSQINHRNVVKLFGCCLETEVPLLVYEFISNGTLSEHLHVESNCCLSWDDRLRIASETARALAYLHTAAPVSVFHRDIKPVNIMLDDTLTAKVSDFGASRSVLIDQTRITTAVQGTYGYLDPEYFYTSWLTDKSDVYSFGVILVELLTRETPHEFSRSEEAGTLVSYFTSRQRDNRLFEILDPKIVHQGQKAELEGVAQLAEMCLRLIGEERPTMKEVDMRLEELRALQKRHAHPWTEESSAEQQKLLQVEGVITTRQFSFEQELKNSSSFPR